MRTVGLTVRVGAEQAPAPEPAKAPAEERPAKKGGRPTKADLLEECAALGIEADAKMTNQQLAALIEAAKE